MNKSTPPDRMWKAWAGGVVLLLAAGALDSSLAVRGAIVGASNYEATRASEQFVVHDTRKYGRSLSAYGDSGNPAMVQLEPDTLLLSAERIRDALAKQLRISPRGAGLIHCFLYAPLRNNENIVLASTLYRDGWQYRLQIPDGLDRTKLVRGIVQVLLLEIANRGTAGKSAEIPSWLLEGLTMQVLGDVGPDLVLDSVPPNALRRSIREIKGATILAEAQGYFRVRKPLMFSELSEPLLVELPAVQMRDYQLSAHLFVAQLLELPGGHDKLMAMLRDLPNCWNWQTAFLRAFRFERLLDAEKWWFVVAAAFQGRDNASYSSHRASLASLEDILRTPAQLRLNTNDVPVRIEATLTQVVSDWDYAVQRSVLQQKLAQFALLRPSVPQEVALLMDGYMACVQNYLLKRDRSGRFSDSKRENVAPAHLLVQDMVQQLTALDRQRAMLRQQGGPDAAIAGAPGF